MDLKAEGKPVTLDNLPGLTVTGNSAWRQRVDNSNWEKHAKLATEQLKAATEKAAADKHAEEENKAEATTVKAKPEAVGIKALYLREGDNPGPEKTVEFKTRIKSTNEYKTTMHRPGIVVRAMSPQGSHYSKRMDDSSFNVWTGNILEVLRVHQGDEYHVYSFRSKKRGIVKIALLEMADGPQAVLADGAPVPTIPAVSTVRV